MILNIIFGILMVIGMVLVLRDNDAEIVAWRSGQYGKAALLLIWWVVKIIIFFFFAPIILLFWIFR